MTATATVICNLALTRIGEQTVTDAVTPGPSTNEIKCNLIYTQAQAELNTEGPLDGWKFATRRKRLDREKLVITSIEELVADSTVTVYITDHTLDAGDLVEIDGTTSYDGEYEVLTVTGTTTISITADYVADESGSAYWTSADYANRFAIPTSLRVESAKVGGSELTDWIREGVHVLTNQADSDVDFHYIEAITTTTLFPTYFTKVLVLDVAIGLVYALNQDLKAVEHLEFDRDKAYNKAIALDEQEKYVQQSSSSWVDAGNITDTLE